MNNLMRTFMVAALLNARAAVAQTAAPAAAPVAPVTTSKQTTGTTTTGMAEPRFAAPIGHRQPRPADIGSSGAAVIGRTDEESAALDRGLKICRGC